MLSLVRTRTQARPARRSGILRELVLASACLLAAFGLTACGEDGTTDENADASSAAETPAGEVTFEEGWVKAAESGMSAAFGKLVNGTDHDVTLVSVSAPASDEMQLHETIPQKDGTMSMQEKDGGFMIPAGSHHHFEPGADHLMLMSLTDPIKAGDEVPFTLTFDDGSTLDVTLVARDFDGGEEDYHSHDDGGESMDDTGDMGSDGGS